MVCDETVGFKCNVKTAMFKDVKEGSVVQNIF